MIIEPKDRAVFQRNENNQAEVEILYDGSGKKNNVEARLIEPGKSATSSDPWTSLEKKSGDSIWSGKLTKEAGWWELEVRSQTGSSDYQSETIKHVGIGEVFITAGQSNSANYGSPPQKAQEECVSTCSWETGIIK